MPESRTSRFGIQLADVPSKQLSKNEKSFTVVDRARFQNFLLKEGPPSRLQNEQPVARWIAKQLNADAVLAGETSQTGEDVIELTARF